MLTYLENFFAKKTLRSKNFTPKLCHCVVEAEAVEAEVLRVEAKVIQKLLLPYPCLKVVVKILYFPYCSLWSTGQ